MRAHHYLSSIVALAEKTTQERDELVYMASSLEQDKQGVISRIVDDMVRLGKLQEKVKVRQRQHPPRHTDSDPPDNHHRAPDNHPRAPDNHPRAPDNHPRSPDNHPRSPDNHPRSPDNHPRAPDNHPRSPRQPSLHLHTL
ncbi:myelin-associated oligodendrocyte basic protein [Salmo salar]|uniref:Myelin-associated oligodendrocyte basic protein n=1 Tax=Salmo salar TaxID=8030 RepID=A0ABM3DZN5_SALSA|nr:myelin-associated oligodendrocyte basic protein-like [Salmo salar]